MHKSGKRLTLFSSAEYDRLYKVPDFTEQERNQYFMFDEAELELIYRYTVVSAKVYCALQLGYFKAQQNFYLLAWESVSHDDIEFIISHYFAQTQEAFHPEPLSKHDYYRQRREIAAFFNYRFFTDVESNQLKNYCAEWVKQDANPQAIIAETLVWLDSQRVILPGYSTLQKITSQTLQQEQKRLAALIENALDDAAYTAIQQLIAQDDTLSALAALKQEAKDFSYRLMRAEQEKLRILAPLYRIAKQLLPELKLSQQNCHYYAQLAHYYTVYELRRLKPMQTALYLLCYAWLRYQQVLDNLVEAFCYHLKQFDEASRLAAREQLLAYHRQPKTSPYTLGQLLQLFVDDTLPEHTLFNTVKQQAFAILPKETLMGL